MRLRDCVDRLALKAGGRLGRWRPTPETLGRHRWLRWLGPGLQHPRLWSVSRHGIALGLAIGVFFGLLIPIAQMPLSAAAAVLLRANLPAAVASTFVTNPVTVAPLYYVAWRLGETMLGTPAAVAPRTRPAAPQAGAVAGAPWWQASWQRLQGVGKPLLLGLALMATLTGTAAYALVSVLWWLHRCWRRRSAPAQEGQPCGG